MAKAKVGKSRRAADVKRHAGRNAKGGKLDKLAASATAAQKKRGSNFGEPSDESVKRHINWIERAQRDFDKAQEVAKSAQGVLRNRYKAAKHDGIDVDALKEAFAKANRSVNEVVSETRNIGRYLRIMGAEVASPQLNLFSFLDAEAPPQAEPRLEGEAAGKNGQPREENPHLAGSDAWMLWDTGWRIGVDVLKGDLAEGTVTH